MKMGGDPTEMELRVLLANCNGFTLPTMGKDGWPNMDDIRHTPCPWPACGCGDGPVERARNAIRAMREPTEDMIEAHSAECAGDADEAGPERIKQAYAAMIDAAPPPPRRG